MTQTAAPAPSLVPLVEADQAPIFARPYFPAAGPASPLTASLAHVPEILEVALPFISRVLGPTALDARTKEIVVLRTSALMECSYCVQTHTAAALDSGLARAQIEALRGEAGVEEAFAAAGERALIAWVDEVALGRGAVGEEVTARAREAMGDPELVELTLVVGATLMLNRYCTSLRLPTSAATLLRLAEEGLA